MTLFLRNPGKKLIVLFILMAMLAIPCFAQIDSLLSLSKKTNEPENKADLLNELADIYLFINLDSALYFAQEAITTSRNADYQKGKIIALIHQAEIYRESGKFEKAMRCTGRLKKYADNLTDKELLARYYLLSGNNYMYQHTYNQALEQFEKSFTLFGECDDLVGMGDVQRKIGHLFGYRGEFDLMYEYHLSALKCYKRANNTRGIAATTHNIGMHFMLSKEYDKARDLLFKAANMNSKEGNIYWLSKNYYNLSVVMQALNQFDSAYYFSHAASGLARKVGNPYWEALTLVLEGSIQMNNQKDSIAIRLFQKAFVLSRQVNSLDNLRMITDSISQLFYRSGCYDSAFIYLTEHNRYADSLTRNNDNVRFTELKYRMEIEKTQQMAALKNLRQFYINLLVFAGLLSIIIILFLLYTRQKVKVKNTMLEKENLTNKIELKNKELTSKIMFAQKKNEVIGNIAQSLEDNRNALPDESRRIIEQVIQNLNKTIDEKGWEDFELSFVRVHESFFVKLDQMFPDLTVKERRLCALLRLNMSSKQIAEIAQLLPRSVDTARYRLRKKLGIENIEVDLTSFLGDI